MAEFNVAGIDDMLKGLDGIGVNVEKATDKMLTNAASKVKKNISANIQGKFENPTRVLRGLSITRTYMTRAGSRNIKLIFTGYNENNRPIPLIAYARDRGTVRGEKKMPFVKKSFNQSEIESAMKQVYEDELEGKLKSAIGN